MIEQLLKDIIKEEASHWHDYCEERGVDSSDYGVYRGHRYSQAKLALEEYYRLKSYICDASNLIESEFECEKV